MLHTYNCTCRLMLALRFIVAKQPGHSATTLIPVTAILFGLSLLGWGERASSASWEYQPSVSTGGVYETNPNYRTDGREESASGISFKGNLDLAAETPRSRWTFNPNVLFSFYSASKESNLDQENYYLPLSGVFRAPRTELGFSSQYNDSSTRNAEFEPAIPEDPDNPPPAGSGRPNRLDDDQQYWSVVPYVRFSFSPTDIVSLTSGYAEISYDEADLTLQPGYENSFTELTYQHSLDAKNFVSAGLNGTFFRSEQPCGVLAAFIDTCGVALAPNQLGTELVNDTDSIGLNVGYQYARSATQTIAVTAGAAFSDFTIRNLRTIDGLPCYDPLQQSFVPCRLEGEETNFVGELSYSVRSERTISTVALGRSLQPSSDGATVTQDNFRAFWIHNIGQRLQVSAGVNVLKSEFVGGSKGREIRRRFERDYWRLSAGATWNFSRHWAVRLAYDIVDSEQGTDAVSAQNDIATIYLQYTGRQQRRLPW